MRDKFRIAFFGDGWIVQHSRLGLFWTGVGVEFRKQYVFFGCYDIEIKGKVYRSVEEAEYAAQQYRKGIAGGQKK